MCLVSFVPTSNGFVMSSNRDEAPSRSTKTIKKEKRLKSSIYYPADTVGGTWFAVSKHGTAGIILNGAFKSHVRSNKYRLSRGVMLKEMFDYSSPKAFIKSYQFQDIEPFTLIIWTGRKLIEFRWTGQLKHIEILNNTTHHVWSSCTLYSDKMIHERSSLFKTSVEEMENKNAKSVKQLHLNGQLGNPEYDFVMNRENRVRTISFSQAIFENDKIDLCYQSLLTNEKHHLLVGG